MDENRLRAILERGSKAGITDPATFHFGVRPVCADKSIQHELMEFLSSAPDLACFDGKMFNFGCSGSIRVSHTVLAMHLLHRTSICGPDQTTSELSRFLQLDHTPGHAILGIRGIETTKETALTDDIRLVPYESVPESLSKGMADQLSTSMERVTAESLHPKAALVMKVCISPKTHDAIEQRPCPDWMNTLHHLCLCLTLVGRSTPIASCCWVDIEEWVPCRDFLSLGISGALLDIERLSLYKMTDSDCSDASAFANQFLQLNPSDQKVVSTSLDRLNRSKKAPSSIDKAIDLGIAMEILLLHDRPKNDSIAFPFRLRGAWLLAKTAKERVEIERTLNKIYDCRCQAVHTGKCEARSREMTLPSLLQRGQDLCTEAARIILRKGGWPDWDKMVLDAEDRADICGETEGSLQGEL
jgi:hypothetical protein